MPSKYTYPDSEVLRNKFGITDPLAARRAENSAAFQRVAELEDNPIVGDFDLRHLRAIHRHILQDVYEWAGELRDVDTGTTHTNLVHCRPDFIVAFAHDIFSSLAGEDHLQGLTHGEFVNRLAYHWGEMTALHPFVDGNTRTQRMFVTQLAWNAGWQIDWPAVNDRMREFVNARLLAHASSPDALEGLLQPVVSKVVERDLFSVIGVIAQSEELPVERSDWSFGI